MTSTTVREVEPEAPVLEDTAVAAPARDLGPKVVAVIGAAFVLLYAAIALLRLRYRFELEWMEGGVVDHVDRVLHGHGLYGPPSIRFTPYIYTPLYYYVSAAVAWVLGVGFLPLRLVSFVSSLATFAAIGWLVREEGGDRWAAVAGAGLFAACFRLGGAWFDLARVDSLFLALLFGGLVLARRATTWSRFVLVGVVLSLAFLTKQSALLPALAVLPWAARAGWRQAVALAVTLGVGIGGSTVVLDLATHGWYSAYVLDLPTRHPRVEHVWLTFWTGDLLRPLGIACLLAVAVLLLGWRRPSIRWFVLPVVAALGATAYSSRLHSGGYDNVLLPAYGGLAVLFGLAVAELGRWRPAAGWWRTAAFVACALQLLLLAYDPRAQVPRASDSRAGDRVLAALGSLDGNVYLPGHGWYLRRAGDGRDSAQGAAISDVLRAPGARGRALLRHELEAAIDGEVFDYVVVDSTARYSYLPRDFRSHYRLVGRIAERRRDLPLPLTGTRTAPATVWAPIGAST